jgi:hypothetical protein
MGEILSPNVYQKRLLSTLRPRERRFAESLFRAAPNHGHGSLALPKLDRPTMRSRASVPTNLA